MRVDVRGRVVDGVVTIVGVENIYSVGGSVSGVGKEGREWGPGQGRGRVWVWALTVGDRSYVREEESRKHSGMQLERIMPAAYQLYQHILRASQLNPQHSIVSAVPGK